MSRLATPRGKKAGGRRRKKKGGVSRPHAHTHKNSRGCASRPPPVLPPTRTAPRVRLHLSLRRSCRDHVQEQAADGENIMRGGERDSGRRGLADAGMRGPAPACPVLAPRLHASQGTRGPLRACEPLSDLGEAVRTRAVWGPAWGKTGTARQRRLHLPPPPLRDVGCRGNDADATADARAAAGRRGTRRRRYAGRQESGPAQHLWWARSGARRRKGGCARQAAVVARALGNPAARRVRRARQEVPHAHTPRGPLPTAAVAHTLAWQAWALRVRLMTRQ